MNLPVPSAAMTQTNATEALDPSWLAAVEEWIEDGWYRAASRSAAI
jgi:hypothetical protein